MKENKNELKELKYLIWLIEEKINRTRDEEVIKLLKEQLKTWKDKIKRE